MGKLYVAVRVVDRYAWMLVKNCHRMIWTGLGHTSTVGMVMNSNCKTLYKMPGA